MAFAGNLEMAQAFHALRGYARSRGRRLADVARDVIVGELRPEELLAWEPHRTEIRERP